jgi:hypothetical protein
MKKTTAHTPACGHPSQEGNAAIEPSRYPGPVDVLPGEEAGSAPWKQELQRKLEEILGKRPVRGDGPDARPAGMGSAGSESRTPAPGGPALSRADGTRSALCRPDAPPGGPAPSAIGGHPGDPAAPTEPPCSAPGLHLPFRHSTDQQAALPFARARRES